jgi:hypothetical protein
MGPAVLPLAEKELRSGRMRHRLEFCRIVQGTGAPEAPRILGEEIANAASNCTRMVSKIQEDSAEAAKYREKAAGCKDRPGGSVGTMHLPAEASDRASYLRLAAKFDEKVADSRRELDACAELLELLCNHYEETGTDADLATLLSVVSDKSAPMCVPAWSADVVRDDEYAQMPPVGFSARRLVNVSAQEQDWLPWGPVWGTLRTLIARRASRPALIDCRDRLEQLFVPLENKRGGSWQQAALVAEFQSTERLLMDRLAATADTPAPPQTTPLEYAGEARGRLLAAIKGLPEKPGEDERDKARRLGRQAEMRRSMELVPWHAVLKFVPGPATPAGPDEAKQAAKVVPEPCFMAGVFDSYRESLPLAAFLEMRAEEGGSTWRLFLGTFDVPLRAPVAADIEKGKRELRLELWFRLDIGKRTTRTLGGVTDLCVPVELKRLLLRDEASKEVLFERQEPAAGKTPEKGK